MKVGERKGAEENPAFILKSAAPFLLQMTASSLNRDWHSPKLCFLPFLGSFGSLPKRVGGVFFFAPQPSH